MGESQFETLLSSAKQRSVTAVELLQSFLWSRPHYAPKALPVLRHHLEKRFLAQVVDDPTSVAPTTTSNIHIALTCLSVIFDYKIISDKEVFDLVQTQWKELCVWIDVVVIRYTHRPSALVDDQRERALTILESIWSSVLVARSTDLLAEHFYSPAFNLWFAILKPKKIWNAIGRRRKFVELIQRAVSYYFNSMSFTPENDRTFAQRAVAIAMKDGPFPFGRAASRHLCYHFPYCLVDQSRAHMHLGSSTIQTINAIIALSDDVLDNIDYKDTVMHAVELLKFVVHQPIAVGTPSVLSGQILQIQTCIRHVHLVAARSQGPSALRYAMKRDIIIQIAMMSSLLYNVPQAALDKQKMTSFMEITLLKTFAPYLVYPSVLKATIAGIDRLQSMHKTSMLELEMGQSSAYWHIFLQTAFGYRDIYDEIKDTCSNTSNIEHSAPKLLVCAGCKVALYCSKFCQAYCWKRGHREECRRIQEAKLQGRHCMSVKEHKFRSSIVNFVVSRTLENIKSKLARFRESHSGDPVVDINFTSIPPDVQVLPLEDYTPTSETKEWINASLKTPTCIRLRGSFPAPGPKKEVQLQLLIVDISQMQSSAVEPDT